MSNESSFSPLQAAMEVGRLQKKFQSQSSWSTTCFFIGGTSVVGGLAAQIVPWEESDLPTAHQGGWWLFFFGAVLLVIGWALWSAFMKTASEYDRVKKEFGIVSPEDANYPSRELDALATLMREDPAQYERVMAEVRRKRNERRDEDS